MSDPSVAILDFGSQFTQLIARRLRELRVHATIVRYDAPREELEGAEAFVLSGGPASFGVHDAPSAPDWLFASGKPVLAICYGMQAMCAQLGGRVVGAAGREFGRASIEAVAECPLFEGALAPGERAEVWMSHGDSVETLPPGFVTVAASRGAPHAAVSCPEKRLYGVQFHPEVVHTEIGAQLLGNFAHRIAGLGSDWTMEAYRAQAIREIRAKVGDGRVLCGLSGGVDSAVTALLVHEAIGDRLNCVFVDTGVLRKGEAEQVTRLFRSKHNIPLIAVDAKQRFFDKLAGVCDPEAKRKIIGGEFVACFEEEAEKLGGAEFLAQGTLYPDVIESVSFKGPSHTIKTHHNVGGLPEKMNMALVEPLRELFKDEVRELGRELGLAPEFVDRHPFPGPGLAIRVLGAVTPERVATLQHADAIFLEEIRNAGLYDAIWQAFAVLLPVNTVGVMGDGRTYEAVVALRAVTATDGMTADFYPFDFQLLGRIAHRIVNEVRGVNRVTYDVTSKPPGTIEWE